MGDLIVIGTTPIERVQHREEQPEAVVGGSGERVDGVLGVRHQAGDPAVGGADPGDVPQRAVRIALGRWVADVAEQHPALALQFVEHVVGGDEAALGVLHRDQDLGARLEPGRPGGRRCSPPAATGRGR